MVGKEKEGGQGGYQQMGGECFCSGVEFVEEGGEEEGGEEEKEEEKEETKGSRRREGKGVWAMVKG